MKKEIIEITPEMDFDEHNRAIEHNFKIQQKEKEQRRKKLLREGTSPPMTKEERFKYWKEKHKKEYEKLTTSKGEKLRKIKIEKQKLLVNEMTQMRNDGMAVKEIAYNLKFTRQHVSFILKQNKELINMENAKENRYLKTTIFSKREIEMIEEIKGETGLTNTSSVLHIALTEYYRSMFPAYLKKKIKK